MSLTGDLDGWLQEISATVGLVATRDPGQIFPPCLYMGPPEVSSATQTSLTLQVSVWLLDETGAAPHVDENLNRLQAVLVACHSKTARPGVLRVAGQEHTGYEITAELITSE